MSSPNLEQIDDLTEANLELRLDESSQGRVIYLAEPQEISTEVLIEKYAKGDETTVESVIRRVTKALAEVLSPTELYERLAEVLSPTGLSKLILSCRAVSKVEMEPLRQSVMPCCPKFGLILLLYQKARAPPHSPPRHNSSITTPIPSSNLPAPARRHNDSNKF